MTEPPRVGDIYVVKVPLIAGKGARPRPILVMGPPNSHGDVLGLPGTSQRQPGNEPFQIVIQPEDLETGHLEQSTIFPTSNQLVLSPRLFQAYVGRVKSTFLNLALRQLVARHVKNYDEVMRTSPPFQPGITPIPPAGKLLDATELQHMVDAALDGWLTTGRFNDAFEERLAHFLGVKHLITVNSGSSANLIAFATLTSPKLGERAIQPGDEVIAVAAGFPTTVNPILQYGAVPVFVDVELGTYNIDASRVEAAIGPRTKAIMLAHTLGNPFNLDVVTHLCRQHHLWLIEDCCDALGSTYYLYPSPPAGEGWGEGEAPLATTPRLVGTFGDIGTLSFYPAHHITMGEGGAVFTNNGTLKPILESFRDWGRDCFCATGQDNTCKKRFAWQLGSLPEGYDHKYSYSHAGYNLKITDMQAACGLAQLDKLPDFIARRKANFAFLHERLRACEDFLILPQATPHGDPSWFGFPLTLRPEAGISRLDLLRHLDQHKIGTRLLFGGNLTRQPYFQGRHYRVAGELTNTDRIMHDTFWIGLQPALTNEMLEYAAGTIADYLARIPSPRRHRATPMPIGEADV